MEAVLAASGLRRRWRNFLTFNVCGHGFRAREKGANPMFSEKYGGNPGPLLGSVRVRTYFL